MAREYTSNSFVGDTGVYKYATSKKQLEKITEGFTRRQLHAYHRKNPPRYVSEATLLWINTKGYSCKTFLNTRNTNMHLVDGELTDINYLESFYNRYNVPKWAVSNAAYWAWGLRTGVKK